MVLFALCFAELVTKEGGIELDGEGGSFIEGDTKKDEVFLFSSTSETSILTQVQKRDGYRKARRDSLTPISTPQRPCHPVLCIAVP